MKKNILLLIGIVLILSGCRNKFDGFDMIYRKDFAKAIPAGASTFLSHYFIIEDIKPDFATFAKNNGKSITDVKKIIPKLMRINARFGDANFGFISRVFVVIYPHKEPSKKVEVFYRENIPVNTGTILDLNAGVADMKTLLSDDNNTYDMEVRLDFRSTPPLTIETFVDFSFLAVTSEE